MSTTFTMTTREYPRFIVVEGMDGSGKTTLSKRLQESIPNSIWTCETSHGFVGQMIRQILAKKTESPDRLTMAALFTADRVDHLYRVINPAMAIGKNVICDRYYYSTYLYQQLYDEDAMFFDGMSQHPIRKPDITLVISTSPAVAADRRKHRSGDATLFEDDETQRRISDGYAKIKTYFPNDNIVVLDGDKSADDVYDNAMDALCRNALVP